VDLQKWRGGKVLLVPLEGIGKKKESSIAAKKKNTYNAFLEEE